MATETKNQKPTQPLRILGCASQGTGGQDEDRLRALLQNFSTAFVPFDRSRKGHSFITTLHLLKEGNFDLFVLEGTGIGAGFAAILGYLLWRRHFVLSSGDAVEPFLSAILPAGSPLFGLYERMLYRSSIGFIGWTPYLLGRALTLGATRGITIPGWATPGPEPVVLQCERQAIRARLGIPRDAVVFGMAGSLTWSKRYRYCYGAELVRAAQRAASPPYILIVGDGSGLAMLKLLAGDRLDNTIFFTGRVRREEVPSYLAAMDVASLPQSVDGVGSFRYTTKLPEYRRARLPIVMNRIPMAYDLDQGDFLRLEGDTPWGDLYLDTLARLMETLRMQDIPNLTKDNSDASEFGRERQIERVTAFLQDLSQMITRRGERH